jgi:transcriptional regulator GlxA family with amidase domain
VTLVDNSGVTNTPGLRFGIVLFDGVEELDWVGPWEVLTSWKLHFPDDQVDVFTMSPDGGVVRCAKGARVLADHSYADHPSIDVLIYPGGLGTRPQLGDEQVRKWVREVASSARVVTSVCTGALVLADAGLLDGRRATTHWASLDLLQSLGKDIEVRDRDRFVDDGDVITAAGVSAGIDMALHLVARLGSVERARQVSRYIQYDPEPPV